MTNNSEARQKVFGTLLASALLRWETLVTLMVTIILFLFVQDVSLPFMEWQPWYWLALGGLAEAVLVASTLNDPEATEQALAEDFEREYDLRNIHNRISRERLRDAFEYRRNMLKLADVARGSMRTRQRTLISGINDWIAHMYNLATRIDHFENNDLAARDLQRVPRKIASVRRRIDRESDSHTRRDLEQQLKLLQRQLVSLEASSSIIKRAEIQLESTLSALGTVYAQMSLLGAKDSDGARGQRLSIEIKDEIDKLQDTIDAMDEVHFHGQHLNENMTAALSDLDTSVVEQLDENTAARLRKDSAIADGPLPEDMLPEEQDLRQASQ
ncbi:MAG: hypothetical protein OXG92_07955 [Chloroflexi bacterium]|nr:hypothetical protein [Chloroflexota bacterium]MCY3581346.1 hypothetical protein [Chloroflexota bacterium]MCY3716383.1 hypothetical protein [Chloroflexota bacterium]MDE2649417.1 hypothetical protein [Chloroflexota bacterium]MXV94112.1 hypothetical protein [Chloroflexota bacterium]